MMTSHATINLTKGVFLCGLFALAVTFIWWIVLVRKHGSLKDIPNSLRATGWLLLAFSVGSIAISPFMVVERVVEHFSSSGSN